MITLFLARHGQTDWNKAKRFQSHNDIPLNETGLQQAHDMKHLFLEQDISFDWVFCSPLSRAFETAKILAGRTNDHSQSDVFLTQDERLLEMSMGIYDGEFEAQLEKTQGDAFLNWRDNIFVQIPPSGDSLESACQRCHQFLDNRIINQLNDGINNEPINILIVGHQGINLALQTVLSKQDTPPFTNQLHRYKQHNDQVNIWQSDASVNGSFKWVSELKLASQ